MIHTAFVAQGVDKTHTRTLFVRLCMVSARYGLDTALIGCNALAAAHAAPVHCVQIFLYAWLASSFAANAPTLPAPARKAGNVVPERKERVPVFADILDHGETASIVHVGGWALHRCLEQVAKQELLEAERPAVLAALAVLAVESRQSSEAGRPELVITRALEESRDRGELCLIGAAGQQFVLAIELAGRGCLNAEGQLDDTVLMKVAKVIRSDPTATEAIGEVVDDRDGSDRRAARRYHCLATEQLRVVELDELPVGRQLTGEQSRSGGEHEHDELGQRRRHHERACACEPA
ncbi:hypothetical protein T492DRAFT_892064 [Pavlovales sp. CCMP2436]|nr:hypothetical protein T492DRAFT_892064 [Pavlovales sp. CCMP2436]